jgi:phospholipid-binding lipoprotein MlaA
MTMLRKTIITLFTTLALTLNVNAASDGELILKKNNPAEVKDCFEKINRATFAFNQALDGLIFKPVASAYKIMPSPMRSGVSNSLDNLSNLITIPNNILQGEFYKAGINTVRFVINSTIGILGIIDVAQHFGLQDYEKEDYGQSLAKLGVGPGCYIVLPILGPSTARDTVGSAFNFLGGDAWYNVTVRNDTHHFSDIDYYSSKITSGVDFRAKNYDSIENLEQNSLDFYASVKSLYLQDRQQKILNTKKIIETQNDSDWEEIDNN